MDEHTALASSISHGIEPQSCQPSGNPDVSGLVSGGSADHFDYALDTNRALTVNFDPAQSTDLTYLVTDPVTYAYISAQDEQVHATTAALSLCHAVEPPALPESVPSSSATLLSSSSSSSLLHSSSSSLLPSSSLSGHQQKLLPPVQYSAREEQLFRLPESGEELALSSPPAVVDPPSCPIQLAPSGDRPESQCLLCGCQVEVESGQKSSPLAVSLHGTHVRASRVSLATKLQQLLGGGSYVPPGDLLQQLEHPEQLVACHTCAVLVSVIDELELKLSQLRRSLTSARTQLFDKVAAHRSLTQVTDEVSPMVGEVAAHRSLTQVTEEVSPVITGEDCGTVILGGITTVPGIVTDTTTTNNNNNIGDKVKCDSSDRDAASVSLDGNQLNTARSRSNMLGCSELGLMSDTGDDAAIHRGDLYLRPPPEEEVPGDGAMWRPLRQPQYITALCPVRCLLCERVLLDRTSQLLHRLVHAQTQPADSLVPLVAEEEGRSAQRTEGDSGLAVTVYRCDACAALYASRHALHEHHARAHRTCRDGVDTLRCFVCWQLAESTEQLVEHLAGHAEDSCCHLCRLPFSSKQALAAHVSRMHRVGAGGRVCEPCMAGFSSDAALAQHAALVHGLEGDLQSPGATPDTLHQNSSSSETVGKSQAKPSPDRPFSCPECLRRFASKQARACHVRAFHRHNPFTCKRCGRRCESPSALTRHMRSHTGAAHFQCSLCSKKLTTEYSLKVHVRAIHVGELPYQCHLCEKTFAYKSSLTMHVATHSSRKAFVCDVCGKCFASRSSLRTHQHAHSARKPHPCHWCERSFARKDLLARHQLQSHGIQPSVVYSRMSAKLARLPKPAAKETAQ